MLEVVKARLRNAYTRRRRGEGFGDRDLVVMRNLERDGRVVLGTGTYGVPSIFTHMRAETRLIIGNYSSIGSTIMLGGGHPADRVTTYPHRILWQMEGAGVDGFPRPSADTIIGSDVYAGWGALILSGVTLGDGCIVGSGAVVTKDVAPYAIVGGNPAKVIRHRFNDEQIAAMLEIRWWDWPEAEIRAAVPLLAGEDVDAFIRYARERFSDGLAGGAGT